MYESLFGITPFNARDKEDLKCKVNRGIIRLSEDRDISSCCFDFITKCLLINPEKRISINHALNHPFINKNSP